MSRKIKFLCILVAGLSLLSCSSNGFKVSRVNDDGIEIIGYNNKQTEDLIIPEKIGNRNVVSIGDFAFKGLSYQNINLPRTLERIGQGSIPSVNYTNIYYDGKLADWLQIEMFDLNSVPQKYGSNFYILDQENGTVEYHNKLYSELKNVRIPDEVTEIKPYVFANVANLESQF